MASPLPITTGTTPVFSLATLAATDETAIAASSRRTAPGSISLIRFQLLMVGELLWKVAVTGRSVSHRVRMDRLGVIGSWM